MRKKAFGLYLEKMLKSHERFDQGQWVQGSKMIGSWSRSERMARSGSRQKGNALQRRIIRRKES